MKPGSDDRCKSRARFDRPGVNPKTVFRCNQHRGHTDEHQAKHGKETLRWRDA